MPCTSKSYVSSTLESFTLTSRIVALTSASPRANERSHFHTPSAPVSSVKRIAPPPDAPFHSPACFPARSRSAAIAAVSRTSKNTVSCRMKRLSQNSAPRLLRNPDQDQIAPPVFELREQKKLAVGRQCDWPILGFLNRLQHCRSVQAFCPR